MNNFILRLLDREVLGSFKIRGAQHIPEENSKEKMLRSILGLRASDGVMSAVSVLRAVDAFSYLRCMVEEPVRTYDTMLTQTPLFSLSGEADLIPDEHGRVGVFRNASEWPLASEIEIHELSPTSVRIRAARVDDSFVDKVDDAEGNWVINWPDWTGIKGLLDPAGNSSVTLFHRPLSVDFGTIRKQLNNAGWGVLELISEAGLLELFNKTGVDSEAVAAAGISLAVHNDDILFEV